MKNVSQRYTLIKAKRSGEDPLVDLVLSGAKPQIDIYNEARDIYLSPLQRSYVEASLLASTDLAKIATLLDISVDTLSVFRQVFFDIDGIGRLGRLELVSSAESVEDKAMKLWALSQGLDFLAWRLGLSVNLNPVEGLQELFTLSVYKSKEALFSANASESSMEAVKWVKMSMDLARLLKAWVMDGDAAKRDIELALQTIVPDFQGLDSLN